MKLTSNAHLVFFLLVCIALPMLDMLSVEREYLNPGENAPYFYGFPVMDKTSVSWVNSISGVIYLRGYLMNILFWILVFFSLSKLAGTLKLSSKLTSFIRIVLFIAGFAILAFATLKFIAIDWRIEWAEDYFSEIDLEIVRRLRWMAS